MERLHYIYKITNLVNNKVYIGQSVSPEIRWRAHKRSIKKPTQAVHYAFVKYGIENFKFEIVASCLDQDASNDAETSLVSQENSLTPNGYNVTNGGYNSPKTEEWKKAQSELRKGKHYCPETQFKKGHKHSEESKLKMSLLKLGSVPANKKSYAPEELAEIVADYKSGMSVRKIALRLGVNKTTVTRILIEQTCEIRKCTEQRWLNKP